MQALKRRIRLLKEERERAALLSCRLIDAFIADVTPQLLNGVQDALRVGLLEVEARIRLWDATSAVRRKKIKSLKARRGGGSPAIGEHLEHRAAYRRLLEEFRQQFRQFGDAVAWIALRHDSRIIVPLFALRTHHLSAGVGIAGPVQVISDGNKSGDFLVLDNDLTRCLGMGDITVLRADPAEASLPLSLELKSSLNGSELGEGAAITISFAGPVYSEKSHSKLHADFATALEMNAGTPPGTSPSASRQLTQMESRAAMLLRVVGDRPRDTLGVQREHSKSIRNVVDRALFSGSAYDIPEKGLAFLSVRNRSDDDAMTETRRLLQRLQQDGFPKGEPHLTIADFSLKDQLSPFVPPIALWPIPLEQRASLLSGNVFFACVFSSSIWEDALREQGLSLERIRKGWVVTGGREVLELDRLEVTRIQYGIAFGGVSPQDVARALRASADAIREDDARGTKAKLKQ